MRTEAWLSNALQLHWKVKANIFIRIVWTFIKRTSQSHQCLTPHMSLYSYKSLLKIKCPNPNKPQRKVCKIVVLWKNALKMKVNISSIYYLNRLFHWDVRTIPDCHWIKGRKYPDQFIISGPTYRNKDSHSHSHLWVFQSYTLMSLDCGNIISRYTQGKPTQAQWEYTNSPQKNTQPVG